jgi:homoserine acetyltransferase
MGCMQSLVWGETYPHFSDALAPFACLPIEIAGRNRVGRHMAMQSAIQFPGGSYLPLWTRRRPQRAVQ